MIRYRLYITTAPCGHDTIGYPLGRCSHETIIVLKFVAIIFKHIEQTVGVPIFQGMLISNFRIHLGTGPSLRHTTSVSRR